MSALVASFALAAAGCSGTHTDQDLTMPALELGPRVLRDFFDANGSITPPPAFHDAKVQFDAASIVYEKHQPQLYLEAAKGFMTASHLLLGVEGFYDTTAAADRLSCYENAWSAYVAAKQRPLGRTVLNAAADEDPVQAARIREMIRERH